MVSEPPPRKGFATPVLAMLTTFASVQYWDGVGGLE